MYYEDAIELISFYIRNHLPKPDNSWTNRAIQKHSYANLIASELMNDISNSPFEDAIDVVFSKIMELEYLSKHVGTPKSRLLFSVCISTCNDILNLMKRRQKE